ncbi:MAG: sigma-70 family RNA polymerase sigma factor [Phycisphaerae bacterium]
MPSLRSIFAGIGLLLAPSDPEAGGDADDDLPLIEAARRGDRDAWAALYQRHLPRIMGTCMQMTRDREMAADLAQDTFVKIIRGIDKFDGRARFTTWITTIAMNVCRSKFRSEKLRRHASLDAPSRTRDDKTLPEPAQLSEPDGVSGVEANEDRDRVLAALSRLDPDQRAVLILADSQGLSYEHIAGTLGVAVGTVKSRLFRARTALRQQMESPRPAPDEGS